MVAQLMIPFLTNDVELEMESLLGKGWQQELISRAPTISVELSRPSKKWALPLQLTLFELGDKQFDPEKHCVNNACSVGAALEARQVLLATNYTEVDKRKAVTALMHYVLQMHIPLNCGLKRDAGGKKIYLKGDDLQAVNFAWVWNVDLYRQLDERWFSQAQRLHKQSKKMDMTTWLDTLDPKIWAFETHQAALNEVYPLALGGRYSAEMLVKGQELLEIQLLKAAYRTAAMFIEIWKSADVELTEEEPVEE